jgi:predicted glycogen debranching enzyme
VEESLVDSDGEHFFSTHAYPSVFHPKGYECLASATIDRYPQFDYSFPNGAKLCKELMMLKGKAAVILRYTLQHDKALTLNLRPMTAFRHQHSLSHRNNNFNADLEQLSTGVRLRPYHGVSPLCMEVDGKFSFHHEPSWYYNVEYHVELERGFDFREDLFVPGVFSITLQPGEAVYFAASTSSFKAISPDKSMAKAWEAELNTRKANVTLEEHLAAEGDRFILELPSKFTGIDAGYHWFAMWGRDAFISLAGLTFLAGREAQGVQALKDVGAEMRNGLVPNMFGSSKHAYNSVDASLWYIMAVQQMFSYSNNYLSVIKEDLRKVIKGIITRYANGMSAVADDVGLAVTMDSEGFLVVDGGRTWMDAFVHGTPATPRQGCPVEIAALWYNALCFDQELAELLGDGRTVDIDLAKMRATFNERFWLEDKGYVADVWRDGHTIDELRPNMLFAISLPYAALDEKHHKRAFTAVKEKLLTPYGLRTLAPNSEGYIKHYRVQEDGSNKASDRRDAGYHQGTVWPWPLGAYTEAMLKATNGNKTEIKSLLKTVYPLFTEHLMDAGVGSISEIFDAEEPYRPDGTIAQAWSVSECYKLLILLKQAAPEIYGEWEAKIRQGGR